MKKMVTMALLFACFMFIGTHVYAASNDEVTLIVSADGSSKDEAVKLALRSAIEQTYGTFVSANTTLLDDELVKDEVVTVASGNIKEYKELTNNILPNGRVYVTLQATVSISNLANYAKGKGAKVEFDGANLVMNIQLEELNTKSQEKVLDNLMTQLEALVQNGYDYSIKLIGVNKIQLDDEIWYPLLLEITSSSNKNFDTAFDLVKETLKSLSVPKNKRVATIHYKEYALNTEYPVLYGNNVLRFSDYTENWFKKLIILFNESAKSICISDGRSDCNRVYDSAKENEYYWVSDWKIGKYAFFRSNKGIQTLWIQKGKKKGRIFKRISSHTELSQYKYFEVKPIPIGEYDNENDFKMITDEMKNQLMESENIKESMQQ